MWWKQSVYKLNEHGRALYDTSRTEMMLFDDIPIKCQFNDCWHWKESDDLKKKKKEKINKTWLCLRSLSRV